MMRVANLIGEQTYLDLAASEANRFLELWNGELRMKPSMSYEHNHAMFEIGYILRRQLDRHRFQVRVNAGRLRQAAGNYFIPDVAVIPVDLALAQRDQPGHLETYEAPLPLVVEIWSRSTGDYDITTWLAAYQVRGDAEIWRLHPYERSLVRWIRGSAGTYREDVLTGGTVELVGLPGVTIDLEAIFDR